jgi:dipeptidyl aminopeptidase/acylaminoacyl peptidase
MKQVIRLSLILLSTSIAFASESEPWDTPSDIPEIEQISIGLAGKKPSDIYRFLLARGVRSSRLNADGSKLAYVLDITGLPQLWVQSFTKEGWTQAHQLTFGNGVTFFQWHPNGKQILYGADNNGNEREAYYLLRSDGTQERLVLPHSEAFRRFSEFTDKGRSILFSSTERNGLDFDIYTASLTTGKKRRLLMGHYGYFPEAAQPGGNLIIVSDVRGEDGHDVYLLNTKSGALTALFKPKVSAEYTDFVWAPDGKSFFYITNDQGEYQRVAQYVLASGKSQTIAAGKSDHESLQLTSDGRFLSFMSNEDGYSKLHVMDRSTHRFVRVPPLPKGVYSTHWAQKAHKMAIGVNGPDRPGDVFVWSPGSKRVTQTVASNLAGLLAKDMVAPEAISFSARDGLTLHGLLYLPKGVKNAPVVIDVHGGPTAQAKPRWKPIAQYLLGKQIAILDINVRGSTGYGKTYARLDNQEKRLNSVRDLADAVQWMRTDDRIDAGRVAVMGGSYGGYMVNAVMGLYPDVFKAGASFVGVSDWVRALQAASPALKASDRVEYGDILEDRWKKFYAENSPINTVNNIKAPMFFEHGANDPRDPVTETDKMVKAIRSRGYKVEYLRFPDEGHMVVKMKNRIAFFRRLASFIEQHLTVQPTKS